MIDRVRAVRWYVGAVLLAGLAGLVLWTYTHPPLRSFGTALKRDSYWRTFAIDLSNEGRRPLTLTGITVNGEPMQAPFAVAAANYLDSEVASSVLMRLEERGYLLETGPVPGWRMAPTEEVSRFAYAVRILSKPESPAAQVVIYYRYFGLPMRLQVQERL